MIYADILSTHAGFLMQGARLTDQAGKQKDHVQALKRIADLIQSTVASAVLKGGDKYSIEAGAEQGENEQNTTDEKVAAEIAAIICEILDVDRCYILLHEPRYQGLFCVACAAKSETSGGEELARASYPFSKGDLSLLRQGTLLSLKSKRKGFSGLGDEEDIEGASMGEGPAMSTSEALTGTHTPVSDRPSPSDEELQNYTSFISCQKPPPQYTSDGLAGRAVRTGKPVTLTDAYQEKGQALPASTSNGGGGGGKGKGEEEIGRRGGEFLADVDERQHWFKTEHALAVPIAPITVGASSTVSGNSVRAVIDVRRGRDEYEELKQAQAGKDDSLYRSVRSLGRQSGEKSGGEDMEEEEDEGEDMDGDGSEREAAHDQTSAAEQGRLPFSSNEEEALVAISRLLSMWPALRFGIPLKGGSSA
uniref:Uncharacterized protein n=2 Tax=Palpitomonas bilix TaxID=652834 RepID=A0A7S3LW10_9EUKA|mmetsp:Transcript_50700/g.130767  ORF Transcript_50700/g.130767 Transcript_50700/m.130767 type:complete len:420 (+) Transcript_50700:148-1407(+)